MYMVLLSSIFEPEFLRLVFNKLNEFITEVFSNLLMGAVALVDVRPENSRICIENCHKKMMRNESSNE